ncbi:MAG: TraX family protein [Bacilli bacterium]|nr:TraX family protein [Bacilli bacterium]MDY5669691.1 TraX family protein [Bacilli bacterium]
MKYLKIDGFILKIIAFVLMTFDHIGLFLNMYNDPSSSIYLIGTIFRIIGRLAFPLFILMLVEGIKHSKNVGRYLMRIALVGVIVLIAEAIIYYCFTSDINGANSPLIDLFMCGLLLALLKRKDKYSLFAILPLSYILLSFGVVVYEKISLSSVIWFPFYVRSGYSILGLLLSLGFYYADKILDKILATRWMIINKESEQYQKYLNIIYSIVIIVVITFLYLISFIQINNVRVFDHYTMSIEIYALLSPLIIFFYNGKRGYNKKWFQYGAYLYFPVHIIIIFLIFTLIYS